MEYDQNAQEALAWVLRFPEMDLSRLRPGDWLNLKSDLNAFLFWDSQQPFQTVQTTFRDLPTTEEEDKQLTPQNIEVLQNLTREALQWISQSKAEWRSKKSQPDYSLRVIPLS